MNEEFRGHLVAAKSQLQMAHEGNINTERDALAFAMAHAAIAQAESMERIAVAMETLTGTLMGCAESLASLDRDGITVYRSDIF